MPSTLNFPGPHNKSTKKPIKYNVPNSPFPKKSIECTANTAIPMLIKSGITVSLVKSPMVIKSAQKNSAKILRSNEAVVPMFKKL